MKIIKQLCFLLCFSIIEIVQSQNYSPKDKKIIGGADAAIMSTPYQAAIEYMEKFRCGASMIAQKWYASTNRCYLKLKNVQENVKIRVGTAYRRLRGILLSVKRVIMHPDYNVITRDNDISLTETTTAVKLGNSHNFILMYRTNEHIAPGTPIGIHGFGQVQSGVKTRRLQAAVITLISNEQCAKAFPPGQFRRTMFCGTSLNSTACVGDDGGPGVANGRLAGIILARGYCTIGSPVRLTRMSMFFEWVKNVTRIPF